jgi:hypothetical protein
VDCASSTRGLRERENQWSLSQVQDKLGSDLGRESTHVVIKSQNPDQQVVPYVQEIPNHALVYSLPCVQAVTCLCHSTPKHDIAWSNVCIAPGVSAGTERYILAAIDRSRFQTSSTKTCGAISGYNHNLPYLLPIELFFFTPRASRAACRLAPRSTSPG